jgi:uncharacterized SAM-binding protein YcdF (DUF218 family)
VARRVTGVVGISLLFLVGLALTPPGLQALGDFLVVRDPAVPVDAVIAISGDGTGERVKTASALVLDGYARWLIVSGSTGGAAPGGATAEMVRVAIHEGISRERILIDDQSVGTSDNARHSAALMQANSLHQAILVTSPYHTRRASWIFRLEFLPRRLEVRTIAAQNSFFDVRQWWTRPGDRDLVIREYMKLAGFVLGIR